jgi:DNA-binding response OmpR family regulator
MKKRILVVENNRDILDLIAIVLDEAGYEASLHTNENFIFENIVIFNPDAILLDIVQPTLEGTELCRQIKAAEGTSHIPVKEVCADEVVEKPFDIDGLLEVLSEQLENNN